MNESKMSVIEALLAKAERTDNDAEREAYTAKATELMIKYEIDEAVLNSKKATSEPIIQVTISMDVPKSYSYEFSAMGASIAKLLGCKGILTKRDNRTNVIIVGFESDVARVKLMFASVTRQCTFAFAKHARTLPSNWSGTMKYNDKKSFIVGFTRSIIKRLTVVREDTVAHAEAGTALVLVDRSKQVGSWIDANMMTRAGSVRNYRTGMGYEQGKAAGMRADLGGSAVSGGRRGIEA